MRYIPSLLKWRGFHFWVKYSIKERSSYVSVDRKSVLKHVWIVTLCLSVFWCVCAPVSSVDSKGPFLLSGEQPLIKNPLSLPPTSQQSTTSFFSIIISLTGDPETNQYGLKKTFHSK